MSAGRAKIELLLELKNRIKSGMSSARSQITSGVSAMKLKFAEMKASAGEAFRSIADEVPGLNKVLDSMSSPIMAVTAGLLLLVTTYGKAGQMAHEWQTSMNKVNVTAQLSKEELKGVSDELLDIGKRNTGNLMDVPETFNKIVSAGFDVKTSLAALEPTLLAAKAGFTEAGIAADAATNVMGSTGITDAIKIYDVLFATLNMGKAEFEDVANYLPKIIPGARQVGVSLEQTAGAFAFLTATGLKAEAASTALANAMKSLSDPKLVYGTKNKGGFKGLGIDIFDAHGKMRDLVAISRDLNSSMAGLADEQRMKKFASIGLDMESSMAFSKMSQGLDQLKESIDFTTNSSGQLKAALDAAADPLDNWYRIINIFKTEMISFGQSAVTILGSIGDFFYNNSTAMKIFGITLLSVAGTWGIYMLVVNGASIAMGLITVAQWALNAAMAANPIGLIVTGIGLLIGGLISAYKYSQTFRAGLSGIMSVASLLADVFIGLGNTIIGALTFDSSMFIAGAKQAATAVAEIMDGGIQKRYNAGFNSKIKEEADADKKATKTPLASKGGLTPGTTTPPVASPKGGSKNAESTTGSAQQIKNLTINMDAMVKVTGDMITQNKQLAGMSKKEIENWFTELATRMIRNLETSYG